MLRALTKDSALVAAVIEDPFSAPLDPRMRAIATYVYKLTATPSAIRQADILALRNAGFSDPEVADVNVICGYFNLMNRIALGLGIGTEPKGQALPPVE